ncbi:MAG TPA: hypothetical protein VKR32_17080 [Puia sp.]|nr:hypothetical protein [Puia sp.]
MKYLLFLLLPIFSFAQERINGLGLFKIGRTLSSKIASVGDTTKLYYAVPEDSVTELWAADHYPIAGITVENLKLTFFKDTLYSIECEFSDELKDALTAKYGNPKISKKAKIITCRNGLGITYNETEETFTTSFPTVSSRITASGIVSAYFNDKCEKQYLNFYLVADELISRRVTIANNKFDAKKDRQAQQKLKKKLDGL